MEPNNLKACSFYVTRKRRYCKVPTSSGKKFCPHHSYLDPGINSEANPRIPCPFDPKHYCYLSKLEKHKKKCNSREQEKPSYYKHDINSISSEYEFRKVTIHDITNEELLKLVQKVENIYSETVPLIKESNVVNPVLEKELNISSCVSSIKHLKQQSSLLGLLEKYELLSQSSCIIEFGAGRGQLMYWIIKTIPDCTEKNFILVDREARRYKVDNKFREDPTVKIERLRIDIQHLYLGEIDIVKSKSENIVGVSKHLCGAAKDLALKCLMETIKVKEDGQEIHKRPLGLVMSSCCHHRCSWDLYIGKDYILKQGFSEREFKIMCIASSWATCGLRKRSDNPNEEIDTEDQSTLNEIINRYVVLDLSHSRREEIGRKCKRLIDVGRMNYLESFGMHAEMVTYVDSSISLENVALVAVSKS